MDLKFWIQTVIPSVITSLISLWIAFCQYGKRKDEEKKVEALKVFFGTVKGWREYIQSAANANTSLRNHIRGKPDKDGDDKKEVTVKKFSSLDDVESAVDINGAYLNGLHVGVQTELGEIEKILNGYKDKP